MHNSVNYLVFSRLLKRYYYPLGNILYAEHKECNINDVHDCLASLLSTSSHAMSRNICFKTSANMTQEVKSFLFSSDKIDGFLVADAGKYRTYIIN